MKKIQFIGLALVLNIFTVACTAQPKQPNILFIMLDDMGKEWVSNYEAEMIATPNIDALAQTGMQFNNAWSMPQCTPSRVTLLTGQYPWRHGWINHYDVPRWGHGIQFDPKLNNTFAKVLKKAGYKTCAAGKWQINDFRLQPEVMNDHGFDAYCMWTGAEGGSKGNASSKRYWDPYIHTKEGSKTYNGQFGEDVFTDFIVDFMEKNHKDPMMIYYPMCLPHGPFTTTPVEPNVKGNIEMHKAMVRYTDLMLKKLVNTLDRLKIRDNTVIVWTTDNGTGGNIIGKRAGRYVRGGKTFLTENGVNAPFIVNCPGKVPAGVVTDALVDFTDLMPTFADIAGVKNIKSKTDGHSFKQVIFGEKKQSKRDWIMTMGSNPGKVIDGRAHNVFKFRDRALKNERYKVFTDTLQKVVEIYDLKTDILEKKNLINSKDKTILKNIAFFQKVVDGFPSEDAQPHYTKLTNSLYDWDVDIMNKSAEKKRKKGNHSPDPKPKKLSNK